MKNAETGLLIFLIVAIVMTIGFNCENKSVQYTSVWPAHVGTEYEVTHHGDTLGTFKMESFDPKRGFHFSDDLNVLKK
jgi:hypothetical protein